MQQQNLKILVLAKQVPDTRNVGKDAMTPEGTVNRAALPAIFNPEDLNALIGPVDAGGRFLRLRHGGTAPQAGVTDLLIVVGVRCPHGHGWQKYHAGVISLQSRTARISRSTADR